MFIKLVEQGVRALDEEGKYVLLNRLYKEVLMRIDLQAANINAIADKTVKETLQIELQNLLFRLNMIKIWVTLKLSEFNSNFTLVCDVLDDWIVEAVALENS